MKYYTKITRNEDLITYISNRENEQWFQEKKKKEQRKRTCYNFLYEIN